MQNVIYLLRHGELIEKGILAGHSDIPLSEFGLQQLITKTNSLPAIDHIYCSPLKRCALFAEQFSKQHQIPLTQTSALKEMDFGEWDGVSFEHLWQSSGIGHVTIGDFWQDPWLNTPPNGESMQDFALRIDQWWQAWLADKPKGNSLVVTHAGVIKHLLARVMNLDITSNQQQNVFEITYASLIKINVFHDEQQAWPSVVF